MGVIPNAVSGSTNGVDLVARSGARDEKELEIKFRAELEEYLEWCCCPLASHYACAASRIRDGIKHSTYECSVWAKNCT